MFRCVIQHVQGEHRYYLLKTMVEIWKSIGDTLHIRDTSHIRI